jgi:hypothetical protein
MLARPMATTGLAGSRVECSSAPGRGITDTGAEADGVLAGDMATMAMAAGDMATVAEATATAVDTSAEAAMHVVRPVASTGQLAVGFIAALWPIAVAASTVVVAVVGSMVAVAGSTAAAADTLAVGTGKRGVIGVF